jgi:hypothetical protein
MRLIKVLGPIALVIVAAVAIIGPGSASTQEEEFHSEIVLCKVEEEDLCPKDKIWDQGKRVIALSTKVQFLGSIAVTCTHAELDGRVKPKMDTILKWHIRLNGTAINQCGRACPTISIARFVSEISVLGRDVYRMLLPLKVTTECTPGVSCVYSGHAELEIDDPITTGKPLLLAEKEPLTFESGSKSCPTGTATWDADYKTDGPNLLIYLSLFKLTIHEQELQAKEEPHEEELFEKELHEDGLE